MALDFLTAPGVCTRKVTTFLLDNGHVTIRTWDRSSLQLSLRSSSPLFFGGGKGGQGNLLLSTPMLCGVSNGIIKLQWQKRAS